MLAFAALSKSALIAAHEEKQFLSWMRQTNNYFVGDEYNFRLGIFLQNKRFVQEHNKNSNFRVGLNNLAHLTPSEYRDMLGYKYMGEPAEKPQELGATLKDVPDTLDWRTEGIINPIKDQGQCGSCWAFGSVLAQEARWAKETGTLYSLSEQNLVDCVIDCLGCNGGSSTFAYTYIRFIQSGKFNLEDEYPYTATKGSCEFKKHTQVTKLTGYSKCSKDEAKLKEAVATNGPYSIAIDASHESFQLYTYGIYDEPACSSSSLDHCVGLIGYGTEGSTDYWLVRNSWGTSWGEEGYVRIARNQNNKCGVASEAVTPKISA